MCVCVCVYTWDYNTIYVVLWLSLFEVLFVSNFIEENISFIAKSN